METLLKEVAMVFGASSLFVIVAAWLLKVILIEALKQESRRLIELLKQQGSQELAEAKQKLDIEKELSTNLRTEFMAENAIQRLLRCPGWKLRTFGSIQARLRGFHEDELRKFLVRSGAVSFRRRSDGAELWGLVSENQELLVYAQKKEDIEEE
jgi:hypothetical protein